jgi:hypothetical protein
MSTTDELSWFKSSYSGSEGDNCVEVAVNWFKSSYSGSENDNCVEVALHPEAVHIRDSKNKGIAPLSATPTAWTAFTAYAAGSSLDT